ncbi:MAG: GNAT family N-acetyltransferase [Lachnospiraceae bacterium]|nr:GNAT family N-acetyltransferase [Lachnospiraceae bacterium]
MHNEYLEKTEFVDYDDPDVKSLAERLKAGSHDESALIKNAYYFVRDEIRHSWDVQDKRVTVSASETLKAGVGICWAKANLLAALLRANGIPAGFSYQRLTLGDSPDTGYCIHAMNTVYVACLDKWIRLDARGNKEGVNADFSTEEEKLAFEIRNEGEVDYHDNHSYPDKGLMQVLRGSTDALDMYLHHLPDQLSYDVRYRIATSDDMGLLMSSRLEMLKVVNDLDLYYEYGDELIESSREYFEKGDQTTVLALDGERVIGCATMCYIHIMPTYSHPTGKRAHLMNVYTMREWQRQGIAMKMVSMLIDEAWNRGVTEISLDSTEEGRPLYKKLGFVGSTEGMVLTRNTK